ncbi:MAG: hypothetical protein HY017_33990 [Betaproteobacteria bacterium]|nr:hypothetical protein [Betaproteobacteria bacterium]
MRVGLLILAGIALVGFIVLTVVLPQVASTELKGAAAGLIAGADAAKAQVAAAAEKGGNLAGSGAEVKIAARNDEKTGQMKYVVEQSGVIRGWNEKNAIEVSITPTLSGGKTSWSCKGYPQDAMPQSCGGR